MELLLGSFATPLCQQTPRPSSPSRIESSSLQPVLIMMISPRCSATTDAIVKPMGTSLAAFAAEGAEGGGT